MKREPVETSYPFSGEHSSEKRVLLERERRERRKKNRILSVWIFCGITLVVLILGVVLALFLGVSVSPSKNVLPSDHYQRAVALLTEYPVIDG